MKEFAPPDAVQALAPDGLEPWKKVRFLKKEHHENQTKSGETIVEINNFRRNETYSFGILRTCFEYFWIFTLN